jgi:hypothetical protein
MNMRCQPDLISRAHPTSLIVKQQMQNLQRPVSAIHCVKMQYVGNHLIVKSLLLTSIPQVVAPVSVDGGASIQAQYKKRSQGITKARPRKGPTQRARQASDTSSAESNADPDRDAVMPKGGNQLGLLPSALLSLRSKYFATLLAALFASEAPFDDFLKTSPKFLTTSHAAFESVWPHLSHINVETDNVLFNVVSLPIITIKHHLRST